ncbi:MAG: RbsD/FucU domain-containing protein, partial [Staphylococcus equorum]
QMALAEEMITQNTTLYQTLSAENIEIKTTSHEQFKVQSKTVKAIIRTGEAKPFANVVLTSGVLF